MKGGGDMTNNCNCPVAYNIFLGFFLIFLAIISFGKIWGVLMPLWLSIIILFLGVLAIILNTLNRINEKNEDLTIEEANRLHANEGF